MSKKVRMDKEKFQSLKQLDRIEYLLCQRDLNDHFSGSATISMMWNIFYIWGFVLILALLMYIGFGSLTLFNIFPSLAIVFKWALMASVIIDVLTIIRFIRRRKKLNDNFLKRGGYI